MAPSAIILSGGPASVNAEDAPRVDPAIYELGVPVLGFCYGHQITAVTLGGSVFHPEVGEYGAAELHVNGGALFEGTPAELVADGRTRTGEYLARYVGAKS